ncbi:transposase [Streptomyces albus]|uniref:Transposase n=1 Tax=Streptomyces albus (strain ATCC 21838 / DSM 41398 / FERM P-419 / JCM 4703 / NBRC 107858) TaxID=1081613 RepID=A0A0B5EPE1_STRA4|nr:transposase [Streptomyces albus]AOU77733.1 transposase [Streptomyces albus]
MIAKPMEERPKNATRWSIRSMAAELGMPQSADSRIRRAFARAPHRSDTFQALHGSVLHPRGS